MVEQQHSKRSTVFSDALASNTENYATNAWLTSNATALTSPEESYNTDFLDVEMLYGVLPDDEIYRANLNASMDTKEKDSNFVQETLPNDTFAVNDLASCDPYYNVRNIPFASDYQHHTSEIFPSSDPYFEDINPVSLWGNGPFDTETLKIEEVFQVDEDDIVQSPTLAELNADNNESLFDSLDDNFYMPFPQDDISVQSVLLLHSNTNSANKMPLSIEVPQMEIKTEISGDQATILHIDVPSKNTDISDNSAANGARPKRKKTRSLVSGSSVSTANKSNSKSPVITKFIKQSYPTTESASETFEKKKDEKNLQWQPASFQRDTFDSDDDDDDDSEMDFDDSSGSDDELEEEFKSHLPRHSCIKNLLRQRKNRYFWQYNVQSKTRKGPKMKLEEAASTSDDLPEISDPVFTSTFLNKGVKHAGKARRGDGNDLTPNPLKLYNIGMELEKLNTQIDSLVPSNELDQNGKTNSKKEKNKLASRVCRLKKKAQHEANKIKLFGLRKEQKQLVGVVSEVKKLVKKGVICKMRGGYGLGIFAKIESLRLKTCNEEVAGRTVEYVNRVLENVVMGHKTGGLDIGGIKIK